MRIIAIGGGDVGAGETLAIDKEIIRQSGKSNPHVLFIPTASDDSEDYAASVRSTYEGEGCTVDVLRLLSTDTRESAKEKLAIADLIYVGGGNTKKMLEVWRAAGLDKMLADFIAQDKPVSGLSAGAICWFRVANSDWPLYYDIPDTNTSALECLGFVDLAICPHTRDEGFRLAEFSAMMGTVEGAGIGLDDGCALQIVDDQYRFLASQPNSFAHRLHRQGDKIVRELIDPHDDFRPLSKLKDVGSPIGKRA